MGQAASGGPVCNPFDFHGELHLTFSPKSDACETSKAPSSFFTSKASSLACLATMRGNRVTRMQNNTTSLRNSWD